MSFFKNYLKPFNGKEAAAKAAAPTEKTNLNANPSAEASGLTTDIPTPWMKSGAALPVDTSRSTSRLASPYGMGHPQNSTTDDVRDIRSDVMINWLHQRQLESMWTSNGPDEGIVLKRSRGQFTACPAELAQEENGLFDAVRKLNVKVAMTVNTRVIKLFLARTQLPYVPLQDGLRLQILPTVSALPSCQKHHFAAFIEDSSLLVVWDDDPRLVLERAASIENQLMALVWEVDSTEDEKAGIEGKDVLMTELSENASDNAEVDEDLVAKPRKLKLQQTFMTAATLVLIIAAIGGGWRQVAIELGTDHNYIRLAFVLVVPLQTWMGLFFMQTLVGCMVQMFGPVSQVKENSKFYSGTRPMRIRNRQLPHVTIQCPVYKEGLRAVIEPTIKSVKIAISTYEMQGGTANIFVNDDGMQILSEEKAQARRDFYDEHNIGWVARPKHNPKPEEGELKFVRAGKFKKASNMNYALALSTRVEDRLAAVVRPQSWTADNEIAAYHDCLKQVLEEDEGRTWAEGNIRIGDYILIIDSDTRVPADCFLDAVSEMEQSPQVAILQFNSGVMNITTSFFENGITFFTNLIYTAVQYAVASGDVSPFLGHNAMLRWSAVQDVGYEVDNPADAYGGTAKYWSEETVSEDFDMALRLQSAGYLCRFAAYTGEGFKEGVSLTVYDELARWEKYAYGCNELLFNPLRYWFTKGPFTPLFRRFIGSCMPLPSKFTIMAYVGTYYAIGSAWLLTLVNYFLTGWYVTQLDHYYFESFKLFFSIVVVFSGLGNFSLAIFRYRLGTKTLFGALLENFKWVLMLATFIGGMSMHVSQALLSHMFSIDMSWGATSKEAENISFFDEVPRVLKSFKYMFISCLISITMLIVLSVGPVPYFWKIDTFVSIFPLAIITADHFLVPIVLNPNLMLFTW